MFGNLQGWIVAAVMFVLIALGVWQVSSVNNLTPLTKFGKDETLFEPLTISVAPTSIVAMDMAGDATESYRTAIDDIRRNTSKYESAIASNDLNTIKSLPAVKSALAAAALNSGTLLIKNVDDNVGYSTMENDDMKALLLLGKNLEIGGLYAHEKDAKLGRKLFEAQFALGAKMFNERINYWEAFFGIGQMRSAAEGMKIIATKANDTAEVEKLTAFNEAAGKLVEKDGVMDRMWRVLGSVKPQTINDHAGDVYAFTGKGMKERLWRIESILKLGRHKFNVERLADQTIVPYRLQELSKESDPAIKVAVDKADKLTLQDYRMIK